LSFGIGIFSLWIFVGGESSKIFFDIKNDFMSFFFIKKGKVIISSKSEKFFICYIYFLTIKKVNKKDRVSRSFFVYFKGVFMYKMIFLKIISKKNVNFQKINKKNEENKILSQKS